MDIKKLEFDFIFNFLLKWEGELSNDIDDDGRLTFYGISEKYYPEIIKEILYLYNKEEKEKIKGIVYEFYLDQWKSNKFYYLVYPFSVSCFDFFINVGRIAIKELQHILYHEFNDIKIDGIIGPQTSRYLLEYTVKYPMARWILHGDYLFKRIEYYNAIAKNKNNIKFLRGWINRVLDLRDYCYLNRSKFL